jgi:long-chain acyl-CoA synthetase
LPQLLELVYDANEGAHHCIIVVGEPDAKLIRKLGQGRVLGWDDIELQGSQLQSVEMKSPGKQFYP